MADITAHVAALEAIARACADGDWSGATRLMTDHDRCVRRYINGGALDREEATALLAAQREFTRSLAIARDDAARQLAGLRHAGRAIGAYRTGDAP